jgi:CheY-like chemotaxis protein
MDINLPDMLGSEVARIIRLIESEYGFSKKNNITAVSVEGKSNVKLEGIFDCYRIIVVKFS